MDTKPQPMLWQMNSANLDANLQAAITYYANKRGVPCARIELRAEDAPDTWQPPAGITAIIRTKNHPRHHILLLAAEVNNATL